MRLTRFAYHCIALVACLSASACPGDDAARSDPTGLDASAPVQAPGTATASADAALPQAADAGPSAQTGLPCDVAAVVAKHCLSCHGADLAAPMHLLTYADFAHTAVTAPTRLVSALVAERIHDTQRPMPPVSAQDTMSAGELATLDAWIAAGTPQSSDTCTVTTPADNTPAPIDLSACDVLEEFRAHDPADPTGKQPYQPPSEQDHYQCFNFPVPWDGDVHGLRFDPVIDDKRIVHHWVLFSTAPDAPLHDNGCSDGRDYLSVWAPGPGGIGMPDGVGFQMPKKGRNLQLEIHYNNTVSYPGVRDSSGVRVCATHTLRKNTAGLHRLGSIAIALLPGASSVSDTCIVNSGLGPVSVIASWPHMHKLGVHMKTELFRSNGSREIVIDAPFDFRDQGEHRVSIVVNQGDSLQTTCSFVNTTDSVVLYGENGANEMCLNFLTAYPAGGLSTTLSDPGTCMGPL